MSVLVDSDVILDIFTEDKEWFGWSSNALERYAAAFLAGKAFASYRRHGGLRSSLLPDFFIGAHAAVAKFRLLTRDPRQYRTYFPDLVLIVP